MSHQQILKTLLCLPLILLSACDQNEKSSSHHQTATLVLRGGNIYTVNGRQEMVEAVAVNGNKISFIGNNDEVNRLIGEQTKIIELNGRTVTPGLIDSHAHIFSMGFARLNVNLNGAKNYDEVIARVKAAADAAEPGQWILGRGWHQSKWDPQPKPLVKGFQTHHALSRAVPDNPVFLTHASGHAGFANAKAMQLAGINATTVFEGGGEIIKDQNGKPTGIFNELAQNLISKHTGNQSSEYLEKTLKLGMQEALQNGITSVHNAGTDTMQLNILQSFAQKHALDVRIYAMLNGKDKSQLKAWYHRGPLIDGYNQFLSVRSIKLYMDGALGSRGAWLLQPYSDQENHYGMPVNETAFITQIANEALTNGFQLATHAIGDRGNREVLDSYEQAFKNHPHKANDHRFRIEHAQHINAGDIPRFVQLKVIASMQAIHLSSDRPWAIDRLGTERIHEGAYAWKKLIDSGATVINGTDAPVEPINPIACFYATVTRKRLDGGPDGGYEPEQKLTRQQALRSYTLAAAYGEFAEQIKGSIEIGKLADFTIFSQDIMTIDEDKLLDTQVDYTIVDGKIAYSRNHHP